MIDDLIYDENSFEERADFIDAQDIDKWNVDISYFDAIQKKLIERGSKVIVGPRGSGKTHQMKIAYRKCRENTGFPMAIYTSYGKYYHLEPLLRKNSAAISIFHTWVLCKILCATREAMNEYISQPISDQICGISFTDIIGFISQAEKSIRIEQHEQIINNITLSSATDYIESAVEKCHRKRAVIFLDDAALTLTKEYMIEFFDIFRSIRTANISPKASVYPGTTEYGPRFHLKQDGDPYNVWFEPESDEYADFVSQLMQKRFSHLDIDISILFMLRYASFGIPRAFITLLRDFYDKRQHSSSQTTFNSVIDERCKLVKAEYLSIQQKLTHYKSIITVGWSFFEKMYTELSDANRTLLSTNNDEKQVIFGFLPIEDKSFDRMLKFLIEAGLLYELKPVKHGDNRIYSRYIPHFIFLFQKKSFSKSKGFNPTEIVEYLLRKNKHPLRKDNILAFLDNDILQKLSLDLPNCAHCGSERISEHQKYCHVCGYELVTKSSFERCMELSIDDLPLTTWQKERLKKETSIRTVKDFYASSDIGGELRKPKGIGPVRADNIVKRVEKHIEEFLE